MKSQRVEKYGLVPVLIGTSVTREKADYIFRFSNRKLSVKFRFYLKDGQGRLSWQVRKLGSPYPGGKYSLLAPTLELHERKTGKALTLPLLPMTSHAHRPRMTGKTGYFRVRGWHMSYLPLTIHFPLARGEYDVRVYCGLQRVSGLEAYTPAYDKSTLEMDRIVGRISNRKHLLQLRQRPINELHYKVPRLWPQKFAIPRIATKVVGGPVNPEFYFQEHLLKTAQRILRDGERAFYPRGQMGMHPAGTVDPFVQSQRVFAGYCGSLAVAYRLTGRREYYQASRIAFEILNQNIWRTRWGWAIGLQTFREGENLLELAICAQSMFEFFRITGRKTLLRKIYLALRSWPYYERMNLPCVEVDREGREVHPSYPFNMIAVGALTMWLVGKVFSDRVLLKRAWDTVHKFLLPMMEKAGHWQYAFHYEERKKHAEPRGYHYDLFTKMNLGFLLEYEDWRKDDKFLKAMSKGIEFSLENCAVERADLLRWSDEYTSGRGPHFGINHAGLMVGCLALLAKYVDGRFLRPLEKTIRFLYLHRDSNSLAPDIDWQSDWMHYHVLLPLLKTREYGATLRGKDRKSFHLEILPD